MSGGNDRTRHHQPRGCQLSRDIFDFLSLSFNPLDTATRMSADQVTDPGQLASDLSDVLTALEAAPDNVSLLQRQIDIMRTLGMADEVLDTIARLSTLVMLDEGTQRSAS